MMLFNPRACPECGGPPQWMLERVLCAASLYPISPGLGYEYGGESEMFWDTQEPRPVGEGQVTLCCADCANRWDAAMREVEHYNAEDMARAIHAESLAKSEGR